MWVMNSLMAAKANIQSFLDQVNSLLSMKTLLNLIISLIYNSQENINTLTLYLGKVCNKVRITSLPLSKCGKLSQEESMEIDIYK